MKIVFLYGPPAVGKLTVAKELHTKLGYKLLYNHMIINLLDDLFPFHNPSRRKLTREFRIRIIEEAIENDLNLIITAGTAGSPTLFHYFAELIDLVESKGGQVYMVHLTADRETLLERVDDDFRKQHGKNFGKKEMQELLDKYTTLFDKFLKKEHMTIDTRHYTPKETADKIITHYNLP
jgi:deoxyadenosine/deoxycytidine kinase